MEMYKKTTAASVCMVRRIGVVDTFVVAAMAFRVVSNMVVRMDTPIRTIVREDLDTDTFRTRIASIPLVFVLSLTASTAIFRNCDLY